MTEQQKERLRLAEEELSRTTEGTAEESNAKEEVSKIKKKIRESIKECAKGILRNLEMLRTKEKEKLCKAQKKVKETEWEEGRAHKQACKQLKELKEELEEKYKIQIDRKLAPDMEEIEIKIQRNREQNAIIEEAENRVQDTIPGSREETWARNKLEEAAINLLNEDQKERLKEAKKNADKAKGAEKQQKTQRELRILEIELGITRQTREEMERPKKKIVHTEAQKEEAKEAEEEMKEAEQTHDEQKIMQAEQKLEKLLISYLNQEQKEKLKEATDLFNHTYGVAQLEARNKLRKIRVELGLIKEGKIVTMRRETRANKTKEIKKISDRLVERAMKKLGEALRKMSDEPVNEVIRGEEEY